MANSSNVGLDSTLLSRLDTFRKSDAEREEFVTNIINEYYRLNEMFRTKCQDYENEVVNRRRWHQQSIDQDKALQLARDGIERNPFVLVLIDGDGVLFDDDLLAAGSDGGSEAAHKLSSEIKQVIHDRHENTSNWMIMVHIYANLEGLSKRLGSLSMIDSPARLHAFSRAFSMNQPLFNFLDVGTGKEYADYKIKEMFQLFLYNAHCKHIIFGGTHDNGYLTMLNQYKRDDFISKRLTLLESTPAEPGYRALGYPIVRFDSVFRNQPLPEIRTMETIDRHTRSFLPPAGAPALPAILAHRDRSAARISNLPPRTSSTSSASSAGGNDPVGSVSNKDLNQIKGPATGPPIPDAKVAIPVPSTSSSTYATVGKVETKVISIAPTKLAHNTRKVIVRNADGARLDERLPRPDRESVYRLTQRISNQKVCNDFHLLGKCYKTEKCEYKHGERLPPGQQLALRVKARQRACTEGSECEDFSCLFGHVCPNDVCTWEYCHFGDRHVTSMDTVPRSREYEDGTFETI